LASKFKTNLKKGTIYMIVSAIFLGTCLIVYGGRLIYYYNVSNGKVANKTTNLNTLLTETNNIAIEGDGLIVDGRRYIYRGTVKNNYLMYSGIMWRIMGIDEEGNIKLITEETITLLPWSARGSDYENSIVRRYLNPIEGDENSGFFYNLLENPETYLIPTKMCVDKTLTPTEILACQVIVDNEYVGLMNINEYVFAGGQDSYLNTGTRQWTLTGVAGEGVSKVYYIYPEGGIGDTSESAGEKYSYGIRPVITLKANLDITQGSGSYDNPYRITDDALDESKQYLLNELKPGTYFEYGGYSWRIIGFEDGNTKAIMTDVIRNENGEPVTSKFGSAAAFSVSKGSIGEYLNTTFLKTLENQEFLAKGTFYTGQFSYSGSYTYEKIMATKVSAKIGLPQIYDLFTTNVPSGDEYEGEIVYWTSNFKDKNEKLVWAIREGDWLFGNFSSTKYAIRPVIYIKSNILIGQGSGTIEYPYEIFEVAE